MTFRGILETSESLSTDAVVSLRTPQRVYHLVLSPSMRQSLVAALASSRTVEINGQELPTPGIEVNGWSYF